MDPISLLVRSLGLSVLPGINYGLNAFLDVLYNSNLGALRTASVVPQFILHGPDSRLQAAILPPGLLPGAPVHRHLVLNLRITRFWCRALCPLGALLGFVSRWTIFGMEKHTEKCEDCNRCALHCQGGDDPDPGVPWRKAECHLCFNCVGDCPRGLDSSSAPGTRTPRQGSNSFPHADHGDRNSQRRRRCRGGGRGRPASAFPQHDGIRGGERPAADSSARVADGEEFPGALHPLRRMHEGVPEQRPASDLAEAGLEGIWTPVLVPRIGYCEPSCVLCSQVCPTGAIWEITSGGERLVIRDAPTQRTSPCKLGTAFYDRGRCLPWAMATECIVCEEWCPTSPKAIYLRPAEVVDADGRAKRCGSRTWTRSAASAAGPANMPAR